MSDQADRPEQLANDIKRAADADDAPTALALWALLRPGDKHYHPAAMQVVRVLIRSRRMEEAQGIIDGVLAEQPNFVAAHVMQGRLFENTNRQAEASESYGRAHRIKPLDAVITDKYKRSLEKSGASEEDIRLRTEHSDQNRIEGLESWEPKLRAGGASTGIGPARKLYLDLLERALCNLIYEDGSISPGSDGSFDLKRRLVGRDWPAVAHTMIGHRRLRQLREAAETCIEDEVEGDFVEAGVWRGGACIMLRGVLAAYGVKERRVWAADSFEGLPPPDPRYPQDDLCAYKLHEYKELSVDVEQVRDNFRRYGLLDEQVVFVQGLFKDTLGALPPFDIAILRLDGDLYSSTTDALEALYERVQPGGFVIVDDYGSIDDARRATLDFRSRRGITEPMLAIDQDGVYWRPQHQSTGS